MEKHRICRTSAASVYPHYVAKAERKGRSKDEVDTLTCWMTGHDPESLKATLAAGATFEEFFASAPAMNPARELVTSKICGVRVEEVEEPVMREVRRLDKIVDELAKGRPLAKIMRVAVPKS